MNRVEEVYVSCNRRKWFPVAYIPQQQQNLTDKSESDEEDDINILKSRDKSSLMRWQTETTLADFDKQLEAFDNQGLELDDDGDSSICLDESSIDLNSTINSVCERPDSSCSSRPRQPTEDNIGHTTGAEDCSGSDNCPSLHLQSDSDSFSSETFCEENCCWVEEEFVDLNQLEFGSKYQDVDLLVTESVLGGCQNFYGGFVEDKDRAAETVYMTVRPPPESRNKHNHYQHHQQQHNTISRRRQSKEQAGESVMYDKKYAMDSDYREYYRDRPRGEFLTRGAALSSQQSVATQQRHDPTYGSTGAGRRQQQAGHDMGHPQYQQVAAGQHAAQHAAAARLGRNVSSEKISQARNPTILRKTVAVQMEVEEGANATVTDLLSSLLEEEELGLPRVTQEIMSFWMVSPLLEVQLKPHHKPFFIRREWNHFLQRFSSAPQVQKAADEPILSLQRNVFCPKREEQNLKDHRVLELLFEEAKFNILTGRYPCEISDYIMLGGIQARLEIGPYDMGIHTPAFFRQNLDRFLPEHAIRKSGGLLSWLPWSANSKSSPEARLIEQFKAIPSNASPKRLVRKYLEFCWSLPYYGSAFFRGQIETPAKSLTSLVINQDTEVIIAINSHGLHVIDPSNVVVLLGLKFEELSWDYAKPSQENNEDCLPCLFIQFCVIENGRRVSKILQVFSRQAVQMDALISAFVDEIKQKAAMYSEDGDTMYNDNSGADPDECLVPLTTVSRRGIPESCLSNKLSRLTLATFDDEGHCIGHMGSWSFSS